jgi:hypothetical protein
MIINEPDEREETAKKAFGNAELPIPEFTPEYLEAFLCLALSKNGGKLTIPLETLKKYPTGGVSAPVWDEDTKTFTMSTTIVAVPIIQIARAMPGFNGRN